ncbi:MAG: hypothetical protein WC473_01115 [Patescibacteria group bacterium]|jgi:hypothetical protein
MIDFNKFFQSKLFLGVVLGMVIFIVLLLVFQAGSFIGFKKAEFSYHWSENYQRNFAGPQRGFAEPFQGKDLINAHGIAGQIIKIDGSTIIIKGNDNVERAVLTKEDTVVRSLRDSIKTNDLKLNDLVVIIGDPATTSGQIIAKLIRVMPTPPAGAPVSNSPIAPGIK